MFIVGKIVYCCGMDPANLLKPNIFQLCTNLDEDDLKHFDTPLSEGLALNSYLLTGKKNALVDLFVESRTGFDDLEDLLKDQDLTPEQIDLVFLTRAANNASLVETVLHHFPKASVVGERGALAQISVSEPHRIVPVDAGSKINLGADREMVALAHPVANRHGRLLFRESSERVLFSGDVFSAFGELDAASFDDELESGEKMFFADQALRCYTTFFAGLPTEFSTQLSSILGQAGELAAIAPTFGIAWRRDPLEILKLYTRFEKYEKGEGENEITFLWSSSAAGAVHAVDEIVGGVSAGKVDLNLHCVQDDHFAQILASVLRSRGVVFFGGAESEEFSQVLSALEARHLLNRKVLHLSPMDDTSEFRAKSRAFALSLSPTGS